MQQSKKEALNRALVLLKAAGVAYMIKTEDGETFTEGELFAAKKQASRQKKHDYRALYRDILPTMKAGDCHEFYVPQDAPYTIQEMAKALSGAAVHAWGAGNAITSTNHAKGCVELLRIA